MTVTEVLQLSSIVENLTTAFTGVSDYHGGPITDTAYGGAFDDDSWSWSAQGRVGGTAFGLDYSGALTGAPGGDITVAFTGTGFVGAHPVEASGSGFWRYDPGLADYAEFDFSHLMKFEANSFWGWVVALEVIGGGALGGAAGASVGGPLGGAAGALGGASAAVTLSGAVRDLVEDDDPPPPPSPPDRPLYPSRPTPLPPTAGIIVTGVSFDGALRGHGDDGRTIVTGRYDTGTGTFSGTVSTVPLPSSLAMMLTGLAGIGLLRRRLSA